MQKVYVTLYKSRLGNISVIKAEYLLYSNYFLWLVWIIHRLKWKCQHCQGFFSFKENNKGKNCKIMTCVYRVAIVFWNITTITNQMNVNNSMSVWMYWVHYWPHICSVPPPPPRNAWRPSPGPVRNTQSHLSPHNIIIIISHHGTYQYLTLRQKMKWLQRL